MDRPSSNQIEHADIEVTPTEARGSVKSGHMRYVLGISLALAVVAMASLLFVYS